MEHMRAFNAYLDGRIEVVVVEDQDILFFRDAGRAHGDRCQEGTAKQCHSLEYPHD